MGPWLLPTGGCSPGDLPPGLQGSSRALGLVLGAGISLQGEWRPGDGGVGRLVWPHPRRTGCCRVHALESELRTGTQGERAQRWASEAPPRTNAPHSAPLMLSLPGERRAGGASLCALLPLELPLPSAPAPHTQNTASSLV